MENNKADTHTSDEKVAARDKGNSDREEDEHGAGIRVCGRDKADPRDRIPIYLHGTIKNKKALSGRQQECWKEMLLKQMFHGGFKEKQQDKMFTTDLKKLTEVSPRGCWKFWKEKGNSKLGETVLSGEIC